MELGKLVGLFKKYVIDTSAPKESRVFAKLVPINPLPPSMRYFFFLISIKARL